MNEAHYPTQAKIEESLRLCIIALLISLVPKLSYLLFNVVELIHTLQLPLLESAFRLIPMSPFYFFMRNNFFLYGASAFLFALAALLLQQETSPSRTKTLLQVALVSFLLSGLLTLVGHFLPTVLRNSIRIFLLPTILYVVAYGSFYQAYTEMSGRGDNVKVWLLGALIWEVSVVRIFIMLPSISGIMTLRYLVIVSSVFAGLVVILLLLALFLTHSANKAPKKNTPPVTPQEDLQDSLKDLLKKK
ncbi:MAG TPA: hypothetical protein DCE42_17815 [Myxococcales bacterium]|nr:hypothetical protein [Deltaproteobacteria bacterium]HAA56626.1 hypothetical protein [Myxococcales bacterium]|tara:strand:- start:4064 stop:4801 length:738 start_codon:yes stop_codon:yes gene_type:complete